MPKITLGPIIGKVTDTTELFDTTAETWTVAPLMSHPRTGHYMTTLANGGALVVAGITTTTLADLVACGTEREPVGPRQSNDSGACRGGPGQPRGDDPRRRSDGSRPGIDGRRRDRG